MPAEFRLNRWPLDEFEDVLGDAPIESTQSDVQELRLDLHGLPATEPEVAALPALGECLGADELHGSLPRGQSPPGSGVLHAADRVVRVGVGAGVLLL